MGNQFTGERLDPMGLYALGPRQYDPTTGRFLQPDPIVPGAENPQALNRYSYVLNRPLEFTDPSGMFPIPLFLPGFFFLAGFFDTISNTASASSSASSNVGSPRGPRSGGCGDGGCSQPSRPTFDVLGPGSLSGRFGELSQDDAFVRSLRGVVPAEFPGGGTGGPIDRLERLQEILVRGAQRKTIERVESRLREIRQENIGRRGFDVFADVIVEGDRVPNPTQVFQEFLIPTRVTVEPVVVPTGMPPRPVLMNPVRPTRFRFFDQPQLIRDGRALDIR